MVSFPPEIIAEIVQHCAALAGPIYLPPTVDDIPWVLTQISSAWRNVALGTPSLWDSLIFGCKDEAKLDKTVLATQLCLARGGPSKLSFDEFCFSILPETLQAAISSAIVCEILVPMSHRLRELHFCCNTHIIQPFFALPPGSIDFLEIFDFRTPSCVSSPMPNLPVKSAPVFESAPRLRKAILTSSDAWTARIDFRIFLSSNLSQLTDVHCVGVFMPSSMCRKILLQCTRLRHCTLGISFENDPQHANQPSIIAANLTSFVLHIRCVLDGGASFLQSLAFPRLQSLEIRAQECRQPWPLQNLISLHSRSSFHLQSLGLWLWVTPEIETILEHFPALIEMDMNLAGEPLGSSVLRRIASGGLVPHLESISCSVTGSTSFVRLFEMMELKRGDACTPPVAQLKTAYLRMSTHLTEEQRRRIIALQNMGLSIKLLSE